MMLFQADTTLGLFLQCWCGAWIYMFIRFQAVFDYSVLPGWLRNDKKRVRRVVSVSQKTFSESLHRFTQRWF